MVAEAPHITVFRLMRLRIEAVIHKHRSGFFVSFPLFV